MLRTWIGIYLIIALLNIITARECMSPGKVLSDQSGNCDGFTLCLRGVDGKFTQYNLTCPTGFIYNHMHNVCTNDTHYQCVSQYQCTSEGLFANVFADDCNSYIACVIGLNDKFSARSVMCSSNQIFNSVEGSCVNLNETSFKCHSQEDDIVTAHGSTNGSSRLVFNCLLLWPLVSFVISEIIKC